MNPLIGAISKWKYLLLLKLEKSRNIAMSVSFTSISYLFFVDLEMYVLEPQRTCFMLSFLDFFVIACNLWSLLLKHNCNKKLSIFHNRIRMIARDYLIESDL